MQKVVTNPWFDGRIEEALELYTSCLEDARIISITRYPGVGMGKTGDIMTAEFELARQDFALSMAVPISPIARQCRS